MATELLQCIRIIACNSFPYQTTFCSFHSLCPPINRTWE